MDSALAYVGCILFLTSIPVLVWVGRFSPEAWMLYFLLWSIHLSLRVLDGEGSLRDAAAMAVCTTLAVLSKWLALPILALNLFALLTVPARARTRALWLATYALCAGILAALMLTKLSLDRVLPVLLRQAHGARGFFPTWFLRTQEPFLVHHVLVFALGICGLAAMLRGAQGSRARLATLLAVLLLMMLLIIQRPQWHYFFGFYWMFPAAAACALAGWMERRTSWQHDSAAVIAGAVILVLCNAWAYPSLGATYGRYHDAFTQHAEVARAHPAWLPAPWEFAYPGYELSGNPAFVFPVYGKQLRAILDAQRAQEKGDQPLLTW